MGFEQIGKVLQRTIQDAGIARQIDAARVIAKAEKLLLRLWGEEKARRVHFISFSEGSLKAESASGAALQELKLAEARFVNELNRQLDAKIVHSLNRRQA